ncbi:F-box protein At2g02240-like [Nymphaea colorata]|nr:F-box protein At2g02240-like [Nymphaea colorata]
MAVFQSVVLPPKSVWVWWADNSKYWKVSPMQNSRFSQKAELLQVCWLQVQGTFDTAILNKDTTYSLLYFFKHNDRASGLEDGTEVSLTERWEDDLQTPSASETRELRLHKTGWRRMASN